MGHVQHPTHAAGDPKTARLIAEKIGTRMHRAFYAAIQADPPLEPQQLLTLLATAYHQDVCELLPDPPETLLTFPAEVANQTRAARNGCSDHLRGLAQRGLVRGSALAGYELIL